MDTINKTSKTETLYWIGGIREILWEGGILSKHIIWFDESIVKVSERQVFAHKTSIELSNMSSVHIPSVWIQRNIVYDCFIGSEKVPRFRFRIGNNEKVRKTSPRQLKTVEQDEHIVHRDEAEHPTQKGAIHLPRQIHIRISDIQTIGRREGIIHWVKAVVAKIPSHKK